MGIIGNKLKWFSRIEIIHRFAILEQYLPRLFDRGIYVVSTSFDAANLHSLQSEAKRMLSHAGLHCYVPIVEYVILPSGVAGVVELNNNPSDYNLHIRVSRDVRGVDRRVLAILAHEIAHKVLQFYNFPILSGIENEYYTDLATFFLGFGQLTIDGFEKISYDGFYIRTQRVGYLEAQTLYLAKEIIDSSHGTPFSDCFILSCPYCNHKSSKGFPNLYGKHVKCPNCQKEFLFDRRYIFKNSDNKSAAILQVLFSISERGAGLIKHIL